MDITKNEIESVVTELAIKFSNVNTQFKLDRFNSTQKEYVIDIVYSFCVDAEKSYVLEAPTGRGKSIISIFVAATLEHYGKQGYILTSDLLLQKQYEDLIKAFKLDYGCVKGKSNYKCLIEDVTFDKSPCQRKDVSIVKLTHNKSEAFKSCSITCPYIEARRLASKANVTLMNYTYWLMQMNLVLPSMGSSAPFKVRDFIIADEAHNILNVVQQKFSPTISSTYSTKIESFILNYDTLYKSSGMKPDVEKQRFESTFNSIYATKKTGAIYDHLKVLNKSLDKYVKLKSEFIAYVEERYKNEMTKAIESSINNAKSIESLYNTLSMYLDICSETGHDKIVKITERNKFKNNLKTITLKNIDEHFLMNQYFHSVSGHQLYMSATIGDFNQFMNINSINEAYVERADSLFDFSKSPIYSLRGRSMSKKNIDVNLEYMVKWINNILTKHKSHRGIIHTVSFSLKNDIFSNLESQHKNRILMYSNSAEKQDALDRLSKSKNGVLIGPSLIEGIDLKDNLARFNILAKVPYPNLGDPFIQKKFEYDKQWYEWSTLISILQAIGRTNRHKDDWSIVYLLDDDFKRFINMDNPNILNFYKKRLKTIFM